MSPQSGWPTDPPRSEGAQPRIPTPIPSQVTAPCVPLILDAITMTDPGRVRDHNEDYVDFRVPADPQQLQRKGAIYLVADGMGGHKAGEVASQGAVEVVIQHYYAAPQADVGTSLVQALHAANQWIQEQAQADPSKSGMGTTMVAAVILGRKLYVANVGDSRAYLVGKSGLMQITEDHSWVEEQVRAKLLTPEQARRHPQRNLVTRALGTRPAVEVDLFERQMAQGDQLLLCSDGLSGPVADVEINSIIREYSPQEAARLLVARANERGGSDNITLLLVGGRREESTAPAAVDKPMSSFPLIPVLISLAGLIVLLLAGLLLVPRLFRAEATATSTAVPLASPTEEPTQSPTATATPELILPATVTPAGGPSGRDLVTAPADPSERGAWPGSPAALGQGTPPGP